MQELLEFELDDFCRVVSIVITSLLSLKPIMVKAGKNGIVMSELVAYVIEISSFSKNQR